jgi:hypothetical protein
MNPVKLGGTAIFVPCISGENCDFFPFMQATAYRLLNASLPHFMSFLSRNLGLNGLRFPLAELRSFLIESAIPNSGAVPNDHESFITDRDDLVRMCLNIQGEICGHFHSNDSKN